MNRLRVHQQPASLIALIAVHLFRDLPGAVPGEPRDVGDPGNAIIDIRIAQEGYREAAAEHVELIGCRLHDEHRTVGGEGLLAPPVSRESGAEEIAAQRDSPRGTRAGEMQQQSAGRTLLLRLEERVAELAQRLID